MINGSIGFANHPTKPKPQIAATILLAKATTPAGGHIKHQRKDKRGRRHSKMRDISTMAIHHQAVSAGRHINIVPSISIGCSQRLDVLKDRVLQPALNKRCRD